MTVNAVNPAVIGTRHGTRVFYVGIAIVVALAVFAGFSRSYFLKAHFGTPELGLLLHVHGVFTAWVLLFIAHRA